MGDFLASSSSWKIANTGKLAFKLKLEDSGFLGTLWKLLSLYMFHRIIFLLLIVSSLYCDFNRCAVCFQSFSVNIAFTSTQTAARIKPFWRLHIVKINKKINIINSLLCWSETLSMFIQTVDHSSWAAKVRTGWPYRWFWKLF